MKNVILVVEDEIKIADLICKYLNLEGFISYKAETGTAALKKFYETSPDLIILDIMLPDMDGIEICKKIRSTSPAPILLLTAKADDVDRLLGFASGADDYVCKPFNPNELIARIRAILRRANPTSQLEVLSYDSILVNIAEHTVKVSDKEVQLTQMEFNLLCTLVSNPHQVFSREELLMASHKKYSESYERTIDFHIKNLRKKINMTEDSNYVKTVYGIGYKFI